MSNDWHRPIISRHFDFIRPEKVDGQPRKLYSVELSVQNRDARGMVAIFLPSVQDDWGIMGLASEPIQEAEGEQREWMALPDGAEFTDEVDVGSGWLLRPAIPLDATDWPVNIPADETLRLVLEVLVKEYVNLGNQPIRLCYVPAVTYPPSRLYRSPPYSSSQ